MKILYGFFLLSLVLIAGCEKKRAVDASREVASRGIYSAAISDDGNSAVVGSINDGASYWRLSDWERLYNWNHSADEKTMVVAADISVDGKWALTAAVHDMVLWDTSTGKGERYWSAPGEILAAKLSTHAERALLGLSNHTAVIFDIQRGGIKQVFKLGNRVRSVDFDRASKLVLTGSEDDSACLWDANSGERLRCIQHDDEVQLVKLSDDGSLALSVSKYDKAIVWHTDSGELLGEIPLRANKLKRGLRFTAARFSADNKWLLTGRPDQIVQLWDLSSMSLYAQWKLPKRHSWKPTGAAVVDVAFRSDEEFVAAASNGFINILKLSTPASYF